MVEGDFLSSKTVYATIVSLILLLSAAGLLFGTESNEPNEGTEGLRILSLHDVNRLNGLRA